MGRHSPSQPRRAVQRPSAARCPQTGRDFPDGLTRASRKPADGLSRLWTRNPTRPVLDGFWRPSLRLLGPCWVKGCEGRDACPIQPTFLSAPCSTLAGGRALMGQDAPRPDASRRLRRAAEGKGGAAWRRDRTRAQPRAGPAPGRAWRARRGPTPCPQRAPWHPRRLSTGQSYPQRKSSSSLTSIRGGSQHIDKKQKKRDRSE